ncbi:MAG: pantetheine-phosphate adenylyltransferase [Clostridia bacterium]|nr:pantetheine-phosphate adenylyltransferase [Clostridia bacterium]
MKKALITGSFDPVTRGHADLIARAATIFDEVEVVIFENSEKTKTFSTPDRLRFLAAVCAAVGNNVRAAVSEGTVAEYAKENCFCCIIKGVRNAPDLSYEQDMAKLNRVAGGPDTLFLPTDPALAYISSSYVKEFLRRGLPVTELLPTKIAADVIKTYQKGRE